MAVVLRTWVLLAAVLPALGAGGVRAEALTVLGVDGHAWATAAPVVAPVAEPTSALQILRAPTSTLHPSVGSMASRAVDAGVRRTLLVRSRALFARSEPHRPAGAFAPHRATAPPLQA